MKKYLVGGAVRDELLGRHSQDRDFVIIGETESDFLRHHQGAKKVGGRECVYIYKGDEYTLSAHLSIEEDLTGRDLTINAFARDQEGTLHAHPQAFGDLERKILRPISRKNFQDDPLRVYRAARFVAEFPDFTPHESLAPIITAVAGAGLLDGIAAERVGKEVGKACAAAAPGRFFSTLNHSGALVPWLRELAGADQIPAGPAPYHAGSVWEHMLTVVNRLAGHPLRVWMAVCHDSGKTATDAASWPHHPGHESLGAKIATDMGSRIRLPNRFVDAGRVAARWHMAAAQYDRLRYSTRTKLLVQLHRLDLLDDVFELVKADNGPNFTDRAGQDLQTILSVDLPSKHKNLGIKSGDILHQLRCRRLRDQDTPTEV